MARVTPNHFTNPTVSDFQEWSSEPPRPTWWVRLLNKTERPLTRAIGLTRRVRGKVSSLVPARLRVGPLAPRRKIRTRRHVRPGLGREGFFRALRERNVNYVLLRWFEDLPEYPDGEDMDILIADRDIPSVEDLFSPVTTEVPVDLYSVSGLKGADYNSMPYYPPHLAQEILRRRVWKSDTWAVPEPEQHFLSLAYHAVFHKGIKSGLPHGHHPERSTSDHDYEAILGRLGHAVGFSGPVTFLDLVAFLQDRGWVPELDTLRRLAAGDPWISELLPPDVCDIRGGDVLVFVIREWAVQNGLLDFVLGRIADAKLEILHAEQLVGDAKKAARRAIRGGKWDRGPFPVSGGPPAWLVAAYDYSPQPPGESKRQSHPHVKNRRVFVKDQIRDRINRSLPFHRRTNCIHAADDELEAWHYIRTVLPEREEWLRTAVEQRRDAYWTEEPVVGVLSRDGRRSKVEVIEWNGERAVKKTFRAGCERFLEREILVCREFSGHSNHIPPLLAAGSNHLVIPWYENLLDSTTESERVGHIARFGQQIVDVMRMFFDAGYALIGFYPGNLLITPEGRMVVVDFEFLYRYRERPGEFRASWDVVGVPSDFDGELPRGTGPRGHTWENTWQPLLGDLGQYLESDTGREDRNRTGSSATVSA